jgi:hypothetical protein
MSRGERLARIVLTAWAGGMWIVCGVVVPGLFWLIEDKKQAGTIAAQFFNAEVALSSLFGLMYWALRARFYKSEQPWCWTAIGAPLVFFIGLKPLMNAARSSGDMARFGQLHGAATLLFLIACVAVGVLVWRGGATRPAK